MADLRPIDIDDDVYDLDDFIELCRDHTFIDYDGHGYYATASHITDKKVIPSDIVAGKIDRNYPNVVWYNR